jgi:hypothetical protein
MSVARKAPDLSAVRLSLEGTAGRIAGAGFAVGALGVLASAALAGGSWGRALQAWVVNWVFFLSLTLGALFFVLLQHVTKAGWSVVVRRLAEGFAANFLLLAVLSIPIFAGLPQVFEWARPEIVAHDHLLQAKSAYLNPAAFVARMAGYFLIWIALSEWMFRNSVRQDASGDPSITSRLQTVSAPAMYLFALTATFASFDLLMSLEPRWFSTIFGVYFFAGCALSCFALLPLVAFLLQRSGRLVGIVSVEHYHDMGKLMFAFVVFWSYIAFSQYMLIWYANIPEETSWYLARITGPWTGVSWFILLGHFLVPFLFLISRIPKRHPLVLVLGSVWLLLAHWADLYWLAMPSIGDGIPARAPFHPLDATCFLAVGGFWVGAWALRMRGRSLLAQRDPRLGESLAFENF